MTTAFSIAMDQFQNMRGAELLMPGNTEEAEQALDFVTGITSSLFDTMINIPATSEREVIAKLLAVNEFYLDGGTAPRGMSIVIGEVVEALDRDAGLHGRWLEDRNLLIFADGEVDDADLGALNRLDGLIMEAPAKTKDALVIKLLLITANLAMGHVTLDADARNVIDEARALGFVVGLA